MTETTNLVYCRWNEDTGKVIVQHSGYVRLPVSRIPSFLLKANNSPINAIGFTYAVECDATYRHNVEYECSRFPKGAEL
jgi:hypothetical protein